MRCYLNEAGGDFISAVETVSLRGRPESGSSFYPLDEIRWRLSVDEAIPDPE